jgi:ketosteroid isomerase-like protein
MRPILCLPVLASALLSGCVCMRSTDIDAENPSEQTRIERRLNEILDAAAKKDFPRLDSYHLYGPKFTKFSPGQPGRLDAAAGRDGEHKGLGAVSDLMMRADDLKIDVIGDTGIATFNLAYSFTATGNRIEKKEHATLVLVNDGGAWKIVHEHFSALPPNP